MTSTYIAGYDGTEAASAAVRFASGLAPQGSRVIAVNVYPVVAHVYGRGAVPGASSVLQADIREAAEQLLGSLADDGVERMAVAAGSPPEGLHDLAVSLDADLLSIGVTHHGWLGRVIPGTVAHHLLHGSPCPIAVVPPGDGGKIETIAVAYDGGAEAQHALEHAAGIARRTGARVLLLGAVAPPGDATAASVGYGFGWSRPAMTWEKARSELEVRLDDAATQVQGVSEVSARVLDGPTGHALVEACRADVDLMVVGSRGYGPVRTVLMGSISRQIIDHAPCPVIVVPRSDSSTTRDHGASVSEANA